MKLNVFRGTTLAGTLDMQANESFYGFTYHQSYLDQARALPLSLSLPLSQQRFSGEHALPYFEGLLPEGEARDTIARRLGISRNSPSQLLKALGRDCAGNVSILEEDEEPLATQHSYYPLENGIASIAENPYEEISQLQAETRLSLAGGQEKIALYHKEESLLDQDWFVPALGSPSTHILKPGVQDRRYPDLTLNEFLCLRAAKACGIQTTHADLLYPETPVLVIKRYDRIWSEKVFDGLHVVQRIHQEDCCQACGIPSSLKYEHDGGPGFRQIRSLLARHSAHPLEDITAFVELALFNYLIGNCDAHAKNYSLLQNSNGNIILAPAYDLICTTMYAGDYGATLSRSMGMRIGKHENIDRIDADDFVQFARDMSLRLNPVKQSLERLQDKLPQAFETATAAAQDAGFSTAEDLAARILTDVEKRSRIMQNSL